MNAFLDVARALSDPTRVRALLALRDGELCLCQIIELLGLAPSTVSKHLDLLFRAGLVERRKEGRWCYFRLAGKQAPVPAREAIRWVLASLARDPAIRQDGRTLVCLKKRDPTELSACYRN